MHTCSVPCYLLFRLREEWLEGSTQGLAMSEMIDSQQAVYRTRISIYGPLEASLEVSLEAT